MAISDVGEYAHLSPDQIEELGRELDAIRARVIQSRGERDYRYIHSVIKLQRGLELGARALLYFGARNRTVWVLGTGTLAVAKILENMEIGHNVMHGQWDWMNDPEIHSTNWEWDLVGSSADWKHTHNHLHHKFTNIVGMDDDVGFGVLRVTRDVPWEPRFLANMAVNAALMAGFEWGIGLQAVTLSDAFDRDAAPEDRRKARAFLRKAGQQILKDYVLFPVLAGPSGPQALTATVTANIIRNVWTNAVIFCGHFPDGAEKFTMTDVETESQAEWYLRQMLGSANLDGGPAMNLMSGNLSFQIEHHMFPDLPSNRYSEISLEVRDLCARYDLPYVSGPLWKQYLQSWRTIARLSLPDRYLRRTADDAPETRSEKMFGHGPRMSGLATALAGVRKARGRARRSRGEHSPKAR
ncbi:MULTISPECIES: fatty acid desaturase family protein [Dietzia]|uniref:Acyl-CoA desaturase n=1 Tax=Dietzia cinnamea TaxID=321318 RepID=A0AAW5Q799_9ACTN|nr:MULTISPECIES: acyl-CoA desaturase [Dietzia]PWD97183.1 acyl-CoA desaturase [Dietzia maris]AVM63844.1 acyl-CoA desaturase [Dietzia sp. oral taxon 368]MBM7230888.1 acyl-CoA desaturase [Dietzia cinnamea]MCT1864747.1 acyl-CoA desaturase [Dietzia cinnamea]MCT1885665.1 acyl-CoA desaturase [Dietzia cinnamea]